MTTNTQKQSEWVPTLERAIFRSVERTCESCGISEFVFQGRNRVKVYCHECGRDLYLYGDELADAQNVTDALCG